MSDESDRPMGICSVCGNTKHIHQGRGDGKPICQNCNMKSRNAIAAKSKGNTGKWKKFASEASIQVEKWREAADNPDVKTELQAILGTLSELMIKGLGGATAAEYEQVVDEIEVNPFGGPDDTSQEPLEVEFEAEGAPSHPVGDPYKAEHRDAASPEKDSEFAAAPQASSKKRAEPSESPAVGQPIVSTSPADESAAATLVRVSDKCRDELINDMGFTRSEVNNLQVPHGLDPLQEMHEALCQLGEQDE